MTNEEIKERLGAVAPFDSFDEVCEAVSSLVSRAYEEAARSLAKLTRYEPAGTVDGEAFCMESKDGEYVDLEDALSVVHALKPSLDSEPASSLP